MQMAMIQGESVEVACPERGLHPSGSTHLVNGYTSTPYSPDADTNSSNNNNNVRAMCSKEWGSIPQDAGKEDCNNHVYAGDPVSENFCINPIINGERDEHSLAFENIPTSLSESVASSVDSSEPNHGRMNSVTSSNNGGAETFSTVLVEESPSSHCSSADSYNRENSNVPESPCSQELDGELFQPPEDTDDDGDEFDENPFNFDVRDNVFNINDSKVHIGAVLNVSLPTSKTQSNCGSGVDISSSASETKGRRNSKDSNVKEQQNVETPISSPSVHISINTPPVQAMPPHYPISKTQSTPVRSPSGTSLELRDNNPRLPRHPLTLPLTSQIHGNSGFDQMAVPMTPSSPAPGNVTIKGGSVVLGPQIIVNQPPCLPRDNGTLTNPNLDKVLIEAQDKLVLIYKHQTKTSFLPWLKGRQIIPMTEFYTESRILAVDKQGKQTRETVDLVKTLVKEDETRFLVEGEPGMGKTLLTHKLAIDWANKKSLQGFKFVFLILLRDFKDSLEKYIKEELLHSLVDEKFKMVWEYCKNNEEQVLFILDGYDELEKSDEEKIRKLIESRDFPRSKVVVTSRPDVLRTIAQRIIVKGFSEAQMFEFIGKYFKLVNEDNFGRNMKRVIEKDYKYRKLAKRPLFCVLLCMLYGSDMVSKLPEKLSELMFKIMLCLIKWNNKKVGNVDENTEAFPAEYEELFMSFGKLCFQALKTDKTRFSEKEILDIRGMSDSTLLLQLGFLSNDSENDILGPRKFWKPVHKIFLEYLAGLYIAKHIGRDCKDCRECREFSSVYKHEHVLQFVVGTLDKKAHLALDARRHPIFLHMRDPELLLLLREAGPTKENCRAVAKLLDHNYATVHTSEVDFEGWGSILAQNFRKLKALEIVWRIKSSNPDQESSFSEASPELYSAFFSALKSNTSINKIKIRATQDGEPFSEEKIELFFSNLEMVLPKENLRELEIKELKMPVSSHLKRAIEGATCQMDKKALGFLEILRLDMFMGDEDLYVLCDRLRKCAPNLKELQLTGLVIGSKGFSSLVELLKKSKNLQKLHISMDKAHLQQNSRIFLSEYGNGYTPTVMQTDQKRMNRIAVNESKRAYNERKFSMEAEAGSIEPSCSSNDSSSGGSKVNSKGPRKHFMPNASQEKVHQQQHNSTEYYTEEEMDNLQNLDDEDSAVGDQQRQSFISQHLSTKELDEDGNPCARSLPKGSRSPCLSGEGRAHHPSGTSGACNEKRVYTTMKDPTKELSYLFQDPFNSGVKISYKANHYSFIQGDGENLPLPLCNDREHRSVFHDLFSALPESSIKSLTLDYPCLYLSTFDLVCLGDAIRKTKHLTMLKLQNLKMAKKYIPVVLGLGQSQSLTTVMLESTGVVITDSAFARACTALRNNTTLKSLSLARWEFSIQDKAMAVRYFRDLLSCWKVTDLNLANCNIDIGVGMAMAPTLFTPPLLLPIHAPIRNWSCIKTVRLPNVKLKEPLGLERRGHLLLPILRHCPNLTILDLSASPNHSTPLDDNATRKFFQLLGTNFKKLRELTLCNWEFRFKQYEETCLEIGHLVRSCAELKVLVLDKVSEVRSGLSIRTPCRTTFLHQLVNNLPRLGELSLCCYRIDAFELDRDTAAHLGACFHDHWNSSAKFKLKFFGLPPHVEAALHDSLKKDNFSVVISQGYPLEIKVKRRCILSA